MTLNFSSSCFYLQNARPTGVLHHTWPIVYFSEEKTQLQGGITKTNGLTYDLASWTQDLTSSQPAEAEHKSDCLEGREGLKRDAEGYNPLY